MEIVRKSKRITVRTLAKKDYEAWKEYDASMLSKKNKWDQEKRPDSELTKTKFNAVLKQQEYLRKKDYFYDLYVFENKSKKIVGKVSAMNVTRSLSQSAYLGYFIHNKFWGQGFGKESVKMMIDIAFRELKLHRLEAGIEGTNRRSIRLAKSLGLRKEGTKKRMVYLRGGWQDLVMYSITSEEVDIKWKGATENRLV